MFYLQELTKSSIILCFNILGSGDYSIFKKYKCQVSSITAAYLFQGYGIKVLKQGTKSIILAGKVMPLVV